MDLLKKSLIGAAAISIMGCLINVIGYFLNGSLPFVYAWSVGGEFMAEAGFGVRVEKIFSLGPVDAASVISSVHVDPASFFTSFLVASLVSFLALSLIRFIRRTK